MILFLLFLHLGGYLAENCATIGNLTFTKGADDKWIATVRLLGIRV